MCISAHVVEYLQTIVGLWWVYSNSKTLRTVSAGADANKQDMIDTVNTKLAAVRAVDAISRYI